MRQVLYFAYGSNLFPPRMAERVPRSEARGRARLYGYRLVCNKRGADGSAKANLLTDPEGTVWGALYALPEEDWPALDRFEGGYVRITVPITAEGGEERLATTYQSDRLLEDTRPFAWYRQLIVDGARAQGFPPEVIAGVEAWPVRPDPERAR